MYVIFSFLEIVVSQSAATGRQRLMSIQREPVGGGGHQPAPQRVDTDLPFQPDFPPASSSSAEVIAPEWLSSHPDKGVDGNDDNDEDWEDIPLPARTIRFKYDDEDPQGSPLYIRKRLAVMPELVVPAQQNTRHDAQEITPGAAGRSQYVAGGTRLVDKLRPIPLSALGQALGQQLIAKQQLQPVLWPGNPNYGIPAEGFVRGHF